MPTKVPTTAPTAPVSAPPQPAALTRNPIYRAGKLTAPRCLEPAMPPTSLRNVQTYYAEFVACLNKAWAPVIRKAGFTFTPPKLAVVPGKSPTSPCHGDDSWALYCGDTIYLGAQTNLDDYKHDPGVALAWMALTITHEYGHHVQALTGISLAEYEWGTTANGVDAQREESRRVELQAHCFGGAYFGADQESFPVDGEWLDLRNKAIRNSLDPDHDHGDVANFALWHFNGFEAAGPSACDTYTADSTLVE
jgi:predicted metalloprotease